MNAKSFAATNSNTVMKYILLALLAFPFFSATNSNSASDATEYRARDYIKVYSNHNNSDFNNRWTRIENTHESRGILVTYEVYRQYGTHGWKSHTCKYRVVLTSENTNWSGHSQGYNGHTWPRIKVLSAEFMDSYSGRAGKLSCVEHD